MQKSEVLRRIVGVFAALLVILAILEVLSVIYNGGELFASLKIILPKLRATDLPALLLNLSYCVIGILMLLPICLFVLPFILYALSKCKCYFTLWYTCIRQHDEFKICRAPFRSLSGIKETPDIKIKTADKTLFIHFADVPLCFRRTFALINAHEYCITKTEPGRIKSEGDDDRDLVYLQYSVAHLFMRSGSKNARRKSPAAARYPTGPKPIKDKIKPIPDFSSAPSEYHVLLVTPGYMKARVASGYDKMDKNAEIWADSIMACSAKTLKKRLRGELQTPFGRP